MKKKPVIGLAYAAGTIREKYDRYTDIIQRAGAEARVLRTVKLKGIRYLSDGSVDEREFSQHGVLRTEIAQKARACRMEDSDIADVMRGIDGIFLPGGKDICPSLFMKPELPDNGGEPIDVARDISDLILACYCMKNNIPILGICHGEQILGIAGGCSMIQSMEKVFPAAVCTAHRMPPETPNRDYARGDIIVTDKDSIVFQCAGRTVISNAALWHHQCLKSVEESGFTVTAVTRIADMEIIQGIERKDLRFCVGLQFHPEIDCGADLDERDKIRSDERICRSFFEKLVLAAAQ